MLHFSRWPLSSSSRRVPAGDPLIPPPMTDWATGTRQGSPTGLLDGFLSHGSKASSFHPRLAPPGARQQEDPSPPSHYDICQPSGSCLNPTSPQTDTQACWQPPTLS